MSKTYKDGVRVFAVINGCMVPVRKTVEKDRAVYHSPNGIRWVAARPPKDAA